MQDEAVTNTTTAASTAASTAIDICGDGSIMKEILLVGSGSEHPPVNSQVKVHYTGTLLDGTEFDSSRKRADPFSFKLGVGQVIKGWDEGVATMVVGERAKFTIQGHKAYGKAGSPPNIPPDATLVFDVELLSFEDKEDVSKAKDGSLLKKIVKEGEGYDKPKEMYKVTIHYDLRLRGAEQPFYSTRNEAGGTPKTLVVDDGELLPGLEEALESMKLHERAVFIMQPNKVYGADGNNQLNVPPNAVVEADVELLAMDKAKQGWEMNKTEKLAAAQERRAMGNDFFTKGDLKRAAKRYRSALSLLDSDYGLSDEEKNEYKQCKLPCYLNLSQCALKEKEYGEARTQANKALEIDAKNVKALYRRATAFHKLGDWDLAKKDLSTILQVEPNNQSALTTLKQINTEEIQVRQREKERFSKLFK